MFTCSQYACRKYSFDVFNEVQEGNASRRTRGWILCACCHSYQDCREPHVMYKEVKHAQCIPFIQSLVRELEDPTGKGRVAVPIYGDRTYF